ncbi:Pentalenene oxygenase [Balamuthia mandrillaris]
MLGWSSAWTLWSTLFTLVVLFLTFLLKKLTPSKALAHVPGPPPSFFFGNVKELSEDPLAAICALAEKYGGEEGVSRYLYFRQPILLVSSPQWAQHVLSGDSAASFEKERDPFMAEIVGNGLLVSQGEFWKRQRKIMQPVFSATSMREAFPAITKTALVALERWKDLRSINVREEMANFALDVISLAAFSHELNALTDKEGALSRAITEVLEETEKRVFQQLPFHKLPFSRGARRFDAAKKVIDDSLLQIIRAKRQRMMLDEKDTDSHAKMDVLDRLLRAVDEDTGERLSDQQLVDEAMSILLAGHETTANASAFAFYLLSKYPEQEAKVMQEIDEVLGEQIPTPQLMGQLEYLDLFVKECMRLYPPAVQLADRLMAKDDVIGGYHIPKGTLVEIWPWQLHRDERLWKDPHQFRPERFKEPLAHSHAYLPFSRGRRSCIGQYLAIMETKVVIAMTLQRYQLRMVEGHDLKATLTVTLRADDVVMRLLPRQ